MIPHLTHEQLCDLLVAPAAPALEEAGHLEMLRDHLNTCQQCSAEFASLNQTLATFRSTTTAWTAHLWTQQRASGSIQPYRQPPPSRILTLPALWTAAAAVAIAATISLSMHREKPAQPRTAQVTATTTESRTTTSDEALLEEVDATLSSSIPSPMQPLDDPTAGRLNQTNNQRKN
jgi:hypothetical protein